MCFELVLGFCVTCDLLCIGWSVKLYSLAPGCWCSERLFRMGTQPVESKLDKKEQLDDGTARCSNHRSLQRGCRRWAANAIAEAALVHFRHQERGLRTTFFLPGGIAVLLLDLQLEISSVHSLSASKCDPWKFIYQAV